MLRPVGISAVLEDVVGKGADGVEISVGVVWVRAFDGGADGELGKEQHA